MLGELVQFAIGETERSPVDVEAAQHGVGELQCDLRGHRLDVGTYLTRHHQQADDLVLGEPLQSRRNGFGRGLDRVGDALEMGGQPLQEVAM